MLSVAVEEADPPPDTDTELVTEAGAFKATLTFTTANWSTPQVVTVTGVNDVAMVNGRTLDPNPRGFLGVPPGHTDVPGWSSMNRHHLFYRDLSTAALELVPSMAMQALCDEDRAIVRRVVTLENAEAIFRSAASGKTEEVNNG